MRPRSAGKGWEGLGAERQGQEDHTAEEGTQGQQEGLYWKVGGGFPTRRYPSPHHTFPQPPPLSAAVTPGWRSVPEAASLKVLGSDSSAARVGEAGSLFALGPVLPMRRGPVPWFPFIVFYPLDLADERSRLCFLMLLGTSVGGDTQIWYSQHCPSSRAMVIVPLPSLRVASRSLSQFMLLLREVLRDTEGAGRDRWGPPSPRPSMSSSEPGLQKACA